MALTPTEEAQIRQLIAENPALLSLAGAEPTIISKLGATKVNLSDLTAATSLSAADIALVRQGLNDKSFAISVLLDYVTTNFPSASTTTQGKVELATNTETQTGTDTTRAVTPAGLASLIATLDVGIQTWDSGEAYVNPVLVYGSDSRLYISQQNSTNQDPTTDDGANWRVIDNSFGYSMYHARHERASGVSGGSTSTGSYQVIPLNTEKTDGIGVTLSANQFTLPAGSYFLKYFTSMFRSNETKIKLYNTTDAIDVEIGQSTYGSQSNNMFTCPQLTCNFDIATSKTFEMQYRAGFSDTNGLGFPTGYGDTEVYAELIIWKIK